MSTFKLFRFFRTTIISSFFLSSNCVMATILEKCKLIKSSYALGLLAVQTFCYYYCKTQERRKKLFTVQLLTILTGQFTTLLTG